MKHILKILLTMVLLVCLFNSESAIIELNLTSLPKGIYFIRLNSEQKIQAKKIIIK